MNDIVGGAKHNMSDTLIQRAKAGDKQAFAQLYLQQKDRLFRYAYFKLGNTEDAQDAVSGCVTEAYAGITLLKTEKAFSAWLFRILYRECCRILRQNINRRVEESLEGVDYAVPETHHLAPELEEALAILSPEEKDIVLLSVVSGYKTREIAETLDLNHATVRSKLSRALAKMKNFFE